MTTKKPATINTLGSALAGLKPTPAAVPMPPQSAPELDADARPVGVLLRLDPADHEAVTLYARQKGFSLQELVEHAINRMLESEGLKPIKGRPRPKGRRRHY